MNHYWTDILLRNRARDFMARVSDRASQFGPKLRFSLTNFQQSSNSKMVQPADNTLNESPCLICSHTEFLKPKELQIKQ